MKPVELIITNALYDLYGQIEAMPDEFKPQMKVEMLHPKGAEAIGRLLLKAIAAEANMAVVMRALVAAGGPSTLTEICQRMQAVKDNAHVTG